MGVKCSSAGRTKNLFHLWLMLLVLMGVVVLSGCAAFGPRRVPADRFDYNEAIVRSNREQMLLNLIRLRYFQEPVFLTVSSVLTQYQYLGGVGVNGQLGDTITDTFAGGNANLSYAERPTITYLPLGGQEFAEQMFVNVPSDFFFALLQAGAETDQLFKIGIERIGAAENMSFSYFIGGGDINRSERLKQDLKKLERFQRVTELLTVLSDREAIEVQHVIKDDTDERYLVFSTMVPEDLRPMVSELKQLMGLRPELNRFRITERFTGIKDDEVTLQTRGLLSIMIFMAKGIEVPPGHVAAGIVLEYEVLADATDSTKASIPFTMRSSKKRPDNSFAAVRYQDFWFYIENTDLESKRSLQLLMFMFRLQAPRPSGAAPVLTLPAG